MKKITFLIAFLSSVMAFSATPVEKDTVKVESKKDSIGFSKTQNKVQAGVNAITSVKTYGSPGSFAGIQHLAPGTSYSVKVNGLNSFVYKSDNYWKSGDTYTRRLSDSVSFTNFEFKNEPATVEITCNFTVNSVRIRPNIDSLSLTNLSRNGNKITFTLNEPRYLSIEVNNQKHPLFIFADTTQTVAATDYDIKFAAPGVYNIGSKYQLSAGQRVYIEGGALVQGTFLASGNSVKIFGRGILNSGHISWDAWKLDKKLSPLSNGTSPNQYYSISGITMTNSPGWYINGFGYAQKFWSLKCISWVGNTDAPHLVGNGLMQHCFIFNNDDALITNLGSNNTFRDCVVWKGNWGRAMISIQKAQDNNLWEDIDIIGNESGTSILNGKMIAIFETTPGYNKTNYTFRNIRIEEPTKAGFIYINADSMTVSNIILENITSQTLHSYGSPNQGEGVISQSNIGVVNGIHFKCVNLGGTLINNLSDAHIVSKGAISNLDFVNNGCQIFTDLKEGSPEKNKIYVFPTITSDVIYINNLEELENIKLFNLNGRLLKQWFAINKINIADHPKGFYLLQIEYRNGEKTKCKIIKK
ncbi:MAG: T9SS type A sorting domain-containing protein [Saprospiraceae bacterium]